jgi:hypothetical protein
MNTVKPKESSAGSIFGLSEASKAQISRITEFALRRVLLISIVRPHKAAVMSL